MMGALESFRSTVSTQPASISGRATREHLYAPRQIHFSAAQRQSLTPGLGATPLFTVTAFGPDHESEHEMTERAHDLGIDPNLSSAVSLRSKMHAVDSFLADAEAHGLRIEALRFIVSAEACSDPMMFGALARTLAARHLLIEANELIGRSGINRTIEFFQRELEGNAGLLMNNVDQTDYAMRTLLYPRMAVASTSPQFWPSLWESATFPRRSIPVVLEGLALHKPLIITNVRTESELQFLRATSHASLELYATGPAVKPSLALSPLLERCEHCDGWVLAE